MEYHIDEEDLKKILTELSMVDNPIVRSLAITLEQKAQIQLNKQSEKQIFDHSMFMSLFEELQQEEHKLVDTKNRDYGMAFAEDGIEGVVIRMSDKYRRMRQLLQSGENHHEGLRDTLVDLSNYANMAIMLLDMNIHSPLINQRVVLSSKEQFFDVTGK